MNQYQNLIIHQLLVSATYSITLYWTFGTLYVLMDLFGWPQWMRKYKLQPGTNEPVDQGRLVSVTLVFMAIQA